MASIMRYGKESIHRYEARAAPKNGGDWLFIGSEKQRIRDI